MHKKIKMIVDIDAVQSAKHIVLVTDSSSFANASAIYSYILTLHKKVSLHHTKPLAKKLSFVPWFEKSRVAVASSADLLIEVQPDSKELFEFFLAQEIKVNAKMATALYCGILLEYDFFKSSACDGTIFAISSQLIALGADYQLAREYLLNSVPLSILRLKAIMFGTLVLTHNAKVAEVYVSDKDFKSSGASLEDAYSIMSEVLHGAHVTKVILFKSDENNKILKEI